jgi:hypothetical protein
MDGHKTKHIFVSSLEHSAEMHCANLIGALNDKMADGADWPGTDGVPAESGKIHLQTGQY